MKTLIAIPTYNERGNIEHIVADIFGVVPEVEILIIDDNSPDGTGELADALCANDPRVHVLHRPGKQGLGTAYIRGFAYAIEHGYDLVFEMDADFSHDPQYLPAFLEAANDADLVIGSRYIAGGGTPNWKPLRRFVSGGGNIFARAVLGIPIHDCTAGFRCYRTSALATLRLDQVRAQGYAFQVEMAYAMWKGGFRVVEVPIVFVDRRVGQSKMSRTIFFEAFTWVLNTRLRGSPVVPRRLPTRAPSVALAQPAESGTHGKPASGG